jgi:ribosomal protein S18 acetylase RimI-like enzyme
MQLEPASRYSYAELAETFNAGYEGYFTPFNLDEAAFRLMSTAFDDDLDASRVALIDGAPAGICKLAIRGDRGWIGGIGVAAPHRGTGVGEALMRAVLDEARSRGLREVWLEVLVQNEPAIRLYEKLGFEIVRELEIWSLDGLVVQKHNVRPSRSSRRRRGSAPSAPNASPGNARTRRSRTTRASKRSRATGARSSFAARASESRCCRASLPTRARRASCSSLSRSRQPRCTG